MAYAVHDLDVRAWYEMIGTDGKTARATHEVLPTYDGFATTAGLVAAARELVAFRFYLDFRGILESDVQMRGFSNRIGHEACFYVGGQRFPFNAHRSNFAGHAQFISYANAMRRRRVGSMPDFLLLPGMTTFRPLYEHDYWIGTDYFGHPQAEEVTAVWQQACLSDPTQAPAA